MSLNDTLDRVKVLADQRMDDLHKKENEIARLLAQNICLRDLVRRAYNEGFAQGLRDHTSFNGGKPWQESNSSKVLNELLGLKEI